MPVVEQLGVSLAKKGADRLLGAAIDAPESGGASEGYAIRVGGWVLGREARVAAVQAARPGQVLQTAPVDLSRPDIADRFPHVEGAEHCGFAMLLDTLGLEPSFQFKLRAVLPDGTRVPIATIQGRRRLLRPAYEPRRQPLVVTSLARSGTTLLMRLLAEHPGIVAYRRHPYEVRAARYWLHLLRVLAGPADSSKQIGHPNQFDQEKLAVGGNPFYAATFPAYPQVEAWSGSVYVERLAAFCQQSIDDWYG